MRVASHRGLIVWHKALDTAVIAYSVAKKFPSYERFGLASQLTRAAASVPANIAEGSGRATTRDYLRFLAIAQRSLNEVETFLILSVRLEYLTAADVAPALAAAEEVGRMLTALRGVCSCVWSLVPGRQSLVPSP